MSKTFMQRSRLMASACLLTLLALWLAPAGRLLAAAPPGFSCTASMSTLNFGYVDPVSNIGLTATGNLTYTCRNTSNSTQSTTVCFSIGDPHGAYYNNRWLDNGSNRLYFNIYQDAAFSQIWGTIYSGSSALAPYTVVVSVPAKGAVSNSVPVYGKIASSQNVANGTYSTSYGAGDTQIELGSACSDTNPATTSFPFTITATTPKSCAVVAGPTLQLGSAGGVDSSATNVAGNTSIQVTCTKNIPYGVGLLPSNGNTSGAGVLSGTGGNTDQVPYQLRKTSPTGPVWGNNVTATSSVNGVNGTGNGSAQSLTVYAVAPSANYTPDTYSDTVTVYVYY